MRRLTQLSPKRNEKREHSSVGSERLPYKQRVGGSTPSAPTLPLLPPPERAYSKAVAGMRLLFCCILPPYLEIRGRENRILLSGKKYSGPKGLYAGKIS